MQEFTIKVSAGYMFDFLSIYEVKMLRKPGEQSVKNFEECSEDVFQQIGESRYCEIIQSKEYDDLLQINLKLFDLVEKAAKDEVKASDVDRMVIERWKAKMALQERFFPEIPFNEQKFNEYK